MKIKGRGIWGSMLIAFSLMLSSSPVGASQILSWGGRLVDSSGAPVAGPASLEISFFQTAVGGSAVLGPIVHSNVTLADGVFQVTLLLTEAQKSDLFANWSTPVFIEIKDVNSGATIPRQRFSAVPYAIQAQKVPVDEKSFAWSDDGKLQLRPLSTPAAGQFLTRDGSGNLTWGSPPTPNAQTLVGSGTTVPTGRILMSGTGGTMTWATPTGGGDMLASSWDATSNGAIDITKGGTNATTADGARTNLGLGTAAVKNVGTAAGNLVELDGAGKLPAVDGSALLNLPAPSLSAPGPIGGTTPSAGTFTTLMANSSLATPSVQVNSASDTVPFYVKGSPSQTAPLAEFRNNSNVALSKIASDGSLQLKDGGSNWASLRAPANMPNNVTWTLPATPSAGQYLTTDGSGNLSWNTPAGGGGNITDVIAGTGLTGGAAAGAATLNVDVGTTANKILQLDGTSKIPAVDGSQITNLNMTNASSGILPMTRGGTGASTNTDARTNLGLGTAATFNVGVAANNIIQLDANAKIPAVDASQVTGIGSSSIANGSILFADLASNSCASNAVILFNGTNWTCGPAPNPFDPASPGPIGATTPNTAKFTNVEAPQLQLINGSDTMTLNFATNWSQIFSTSANGLKIGTSSSSQPLVLQTSSATRVTITGDGRVGVGTTTPAANAMMTVLSNSTGAQALTVDGPNGQTADLQSWKVNGTVVNRVAANGMMRAQYSRLGASTMTALSTAGSIGTVPWTSPTQNGIGLSTTPTSTILIPSGRDGLFTIQVAIKFASNTNGAGSRTVILKKNSIVVAQAQFTAEVSEAVTVPINFLTELTQGDAITVDVKSGTANQNFDTTGSSLIILHHGSAN
jgi:hypothetical protein